MQKKHIIPLLLLASWSLPYLMVIFSYWILGWNDKLQYYTVFGYRVFPHLKYLVLAPSFLGFGIVNKIIFVTYHYGLYVFFGCILGIAGSSYCAAYRMIEKHPRHHV